MGRFKNLLAVGLCLIVYNSVAVAQTLPPGGGLGGDSKIIVEKYRGWIVACYSLAQNFTPVRVVRWGFESPPEPGTIPRLRNHLQQAIANQCAAQGGCIRNTVCWDAVTTGGADPLECPRKFPRKERIKAAIAFVAVERHAFGNFNGQPYVAGAVSAASQILGPGLTADQIQAILAMLGQPVINAVVAAIQAQLAAAGLPEQVIFNILIAIAGDQHFGGVYKVNALKCSKRKKDPPLCEVACKATFSTQKRTDAVDTCRCPIPTATPVPTTPPISTALPEPTVVVTAVPTNAPTSVPTTVPTTDVPVTVTPEPTAIPDRTNAPTFTPTIAPTPEPTMTAVATVTFVPTAVSDV